MTGLFFSWHAIYHGPMVTIRRARHLDAPAITTSHVRSIREVCAPDYTAEQIAGWSGRNFKPERWHEAIDRDLVWVVEVRGEVCGFGHLALMSESIGEVMGLYLSPEACGRGTGSWLLEVIKEKALDEGITRLQLYSTLTARKFYEKAGFLPSQDQCTIEIGGVAIPCYPMVCHLPPNESKGFL